jgi:hypothetical protein
MWQDCVSYLDRFQGIWVGQDYRGGEGKWACAVRVAVWGSTDAFVKVQVAVPSCQLQQHSPEPHDAAITFNRSVAQDPLSHVVKMKQSSNIATTSVKNRQPVATVTEPSADGQHILNRPVSSWFSTVCSHLVRIVRYGWHTATGYKSRSVTGSRCLEHSVGSVCVCVSVVRSVVFRDPWHIHI